MQSCTCTHDAVLTLPRAPSGASDSTIVEFCPNAVVLVLQRQQAIVFTKVPDSAVTLQRQDRLRHGSTQHVCAAVVRRLWS